MTDPIYAVGDIHGHLDQLDRALALIEADGGPEARIVFLGDLVDRGPDSRGVIDRLMQGQAAGRPWQVLRGNHDDMFRRFLTDGAVHNAQIKSGVTWTHPRVGGLATLGSYGIVAGEGVPEQALFAETQGAVPAAHMTFLGGLPRWIEQGGLLFVHAGIRPGVTLETQDPEDLIWIRGPFLDDPRPHPWLVVHGHTALEYPEHFGNRVDLDGGAGYGRPVHPAVFEGQDCWLLTDKGRAPLRP
ncbi:metallophosphoesterase family protein [Antarcticimicrobium luteum]|uniref:Serine/threonine protein phosphatase n=1 Tax=Antarcticimicrobium luteum TaxID=2547397 RepID=A0A4V3ASD0_9RHOB|nr:metallophosphoesterase family protein [Antarcticimicrobium luteum]TDK50067.1 serine/threonine protein phosphatase [Antarcticimicrobium luteum]